MKCKTAREKIIRYIDKSLTPMEMSEVELHLSLCESCRQEFAGTSGLIQRLEDASMQIEPSLDLTDKIWRAVRKSSSEKIVHPWRRFAMVTTAAAALVIIIITGALFVNQPGKERPVVYQNQDIAKIPDISGHNKKGVKDFDTSKNTVKSPQTPDKKIILKPSTSKYRKRVYKKYEVPVKRYKRLFRGYDDIARNPVKPVKKPTLSPVDAQTAVDCLNSVQTQISRGFSDNLQDFTEILVDTANQVGDSLGIRHKNAGKPEIDGGPLT